MVDTLQCGPQLHPDYLRHISMMHTWSSVPGYKLVGRPVGLPDSAGTSGESQNGVQYSGIGGRGLIVIHK